MKGRFYFLFVIIVFLLNCGAGGLPFLSPEKEKANNCTTFPTLPACAAALSPVTGVSAGLPMKVTMGPFLKQIKVDDADAARSTRQTQEPTATVQRQVIKGHFLAENITSGTKQLEDESWPLVIEETTTNGSPQITMTSQKTIVLPPGRYDFTLTFSRGSEAEKTFQQYAAVQRDFEVKDGEVIEVPFVVKPIIAENTIIEVSTVKNKVSGFTFQYPPSDLEKFTNPQLGVSLDRNPEKVFAFNKTTGTSDSFIAVAEGKHTIQLAFYDGALQKGKSITAQEDVTVVLGQDLRMDIVPLISETTFNISTDGGDATFNFKFPKTIVDEVKGVENLVTLFSIAGPKNRSFLDRPLTLTPSGSDFAATDTLSPFYYDTVAMSFKFYDKSKDPRELIGSCAIENVSINRSTTSSSISCNPVIRRRSIIDGNLLTLMVVNVFRDNIPVKGANVYLDAKLIGITGSDYEKNGFGSSGYLSYLASKGNYKLKAEDSNYKGEMDVGLEPLAIHNFDIKLSQDLGNPPVVSTIVPINKETNVSSTTPIRLVFSKELEPTSANLASNYSIYYITAAGSPENVSFSASYDASLKTTTLLPISPFGYGTVYTVKATAGIKDKGNLSLTPFESTFTTGTPALTMGIVSTNPIDGQLGIALNQTIAVTFNKALTVPTVNANTFYLTLQNGNRVAGEALVSGSTATFRPGTGKSSDNTFVAINLDPGTVYVMNITTDLKDSDGYGLPQNHTISFTTGQATDTIAPQVSSTVPSGGATGVPPNSSISVIFNESIKAATAIPANFIVEQGTTPFPGTVGIAGSVVTFTPSQSFSNSTTYTVTIGTGIQDLSTNSLASVHTFSFTTAAVTDSTPPTVLTTYPQNNAFGVPVGENLSIDFSESMSPSSIISSTVTLKKIDAGVVTLIPGILSVNGSNVIFNPNVDLSYSSNYTATVSIGVKDLSGNNLVQDYNWTFSTVTEPDRTPPTVTGTSPTSGTTGVAPNGVITVTFSESIQPNSISSSTFAVTQGGNSVTGTLIVNNNTVTFSPASNLTYSVLHTVTLTGSTNGIKDLSGNALESNYSFTFTTAAAPDTTPPTVTATNPTNGATSVGGGTSIQITFSESMLPSSINNTTITVSGIAGTVSLNGLIATFTPTTSLSSSTTYTVTVTTGVRDTSNNALAAPVSFSFSTGAAPTVASITPIGGTSGVESNATITVLFSQAMNTGTLSVQGYDGGCSGSIQISYDNFASCVSGSLNTTANPSVVITPTGNLLLANRSYKVRVLGTVQDSGGTPMGGNHEMATAFKTRHQFSAKWGSYGSTNGLFHSPEGMDTDGTYIYVADSGNNRIQKFTLGGTYNTQWGTYGVSNGQFNILSDILVMGTNTFVVDQFNHRFQKFDLIGTHVATYGTYGISSTSEFFTPSSIAKDSANNVYISDSGNGRVLKFDSNGNPLGAIINKAFSGIAIDNANNIYGTVKSEHKVYKYSSAGALLASWGSNGGANDQFRGPGGIAIDSAGNVFVVDSQNHRVIKFNSVGTYITKLGKLDSTLGAGDGEFNTPAGIAIDSSGNIYVSEKGNHRIQKFEP
jgi:sugar lactone lactonase YvrE